MHAHLWTATPLATRQVPCCVVARFLRRWMERHTPPDALGAQRTRNPGLSYLAFRTECPERRLYCILARESTHTSFDYLDKILTHLDLNGLWDIPFAEGGFQEWVVEGPTPLVRENTRQRFFREEQNAKRQIRVNKGRDDLAVKIGECRLRVLDAERAGSLRRVETARARLAGLNQQLEARIAANPSRRRATERATLIAA